MKYVNQKGTTIMELLLYMGLLSILLTIISSIFLTSLSSQLESESISGLEQDGRYILSRMHFDLLRANTIVVPSTLGSTTSNLTFTSGGKTYDYSQSGGLLLYADTTGSYQLNGVTTALSNLQFTSRGNTNGKPTITVSFTLTSTIKRESGTESKAFQSTFGTR